jgi:hypothetical protein
MKDEENPCYDEISFPYQNVRALLVSSHRTEDTAYANIARQKKKLFCAFNFMKINKQFV